MVTATDFQPLLKTALPGPLTQAIIEKDNQYISTSYTRGYPLCIESGEGPMVIDPDGNRFLDFCAGIAVCSTGHSHPEIVKVIQEQAAKFLHMSGTDFYYRVMSDLAEKLAELSPGDNEKRVFFGNSGAEAVEGAIKLARYYTGRKKLISFFGAFHGRTMGALSLCASKSLQKSRFAPLVPDVMHAHYPNSYRCPFNGGDHVCDPVECGEAALDYIKEYLFKMTVMPDEVAAFIVEPIQGEGGYIVPPANFLLGLQELAHQHGILIIADEVQAGVGRTGKMWASQLFEGFDPDILCSAKGLASGLPLGAVIAKRHIMSWPPGTHASTFGGNPVSCAAALKTLDLVENGLRQNATQVGNSIKARLAQLDAKYDVIGQVRGEGLMIGVEMVKSKASREKHPDLRDRIVDDCFEQGLLILGCGQNSIRFSPPLVIQEEHAQVAMDIFDKAIARQMGQ
jgi:4-aminobutyrate aminotransferase